MPSAVIWISNNIAVGDIELFYEKVLWVSKFQSFWPRADVTRSAKQGYQWPQEILEFIVWGTKIRSYTQE